MDYITEPAKKLPVIFNADVCVVGGSCTGVFAAIRAARLGARVLIIEKQNCFGGTATAGLVNIWHTLLDSDYKQQVISGLTEETECLLKKDGALITENNDSVGCRFNSARLAVILDRMLQKSHVNVMLHTYYSSVIAENGDIQAIIVDNKDGRGIISAKFFIDATGDGDIARDLKLNRYKMAAPQPPTSCFLMQTDKEHPFDIAELITAHGKEFGLDDDWGWSGSIPMLSDISFRADNHIFNVDCSKADDLTYAEIEGRQKAAALTDLLKKYVSEKYELISLCQSIGIRDTVHYRTNYTVTENDLLLGKRFKHNIMQGTYRIDIHHQNDNGITFKYLDGRCDTFYGKGEKAVRSNWRDEIGITKDAAKYYSVPFEMLVQDKFSNFVAVGRMINAEEAAFAALRVMVNLNQLGEAAGVAAALCIDKNVPVYKLSGVDVCQSLNKGGSMLYNDFA